MSDFVAFDPELKNSVEEGRARINKILNAISLNSSLDDKVRTLKKELLDIRLNSTIKEVSSKNVDSKELNVACGRDHRKIRMRIYKPKSDEDYLPCIYNIHGGGMIVGDIEEDIPKLSMISEALHSAVVDVDYRLAPEYPYPAGMEDCYDGLTWISTHSDELNIDPSRIGLLGESAGGGLAAAITLRARDLHGPKIMFNALIAPMLDDRNSTLSSKLFAGNWPSWPRELNLLAWRALLGDLSGSKEVPKYAAPARARNLQNLPPTYIEVGELEVFRDEDIAYAQRLMLNNVPVELHVYPGTFHGSYNLEPGATISKRAIRNRLDWLQTQLQRRS